MKKQKPVQQMSDRARQLAELNADYEFADGTMQEGTNRAMNRLRGPILDLVRTACEQTAADFRRGDAKQDPNAEPGTIVLASDSPYLPRVAPDDPGICLSINLALVAAAIRRNDHPEDAKKFADALRRIADSID